MTKEQYIDWIHSAKHIITDLNEYDSNGNHYARDVFEKDKKLYLVEYVNGEIMDSIEFDSSGKAIRSGVFTLKEVKDLSKTATREKLVEKEV